MNDKNFYANFPGNEVNAFILTGVPISFVIDLEEQGYRQWEINIQGT